MTSRRSVLQRLSWLAFAYATVLAGKPATAESATEVCGLPFIRSYPIDAIGPIPRGYHLGFDRQGRLSLVYSGEYVVLNDATWVTLAHSSEEQRFPVGNLVVGRDGLTYYGNRGSWGRVELSPDGEFTRMSRVPSGAPAWVATAEFNRLVAAEEGVYFASASGVAFCDYHGGKSQMFEYPRSTALFAVGPRMFVSAFNKPIAAVDPEAGRLAPVAGADVVVRAAAPLDASRTLVLQHNDGLVVFDGQSVAPWPGQAVIGAGADVSALHGLAEGGVAVAVRGKGLFIFSSDGVLSSCLSTPQFQRVVALANREPGVLWVATEDSIEKVLYRSPLTSFGQQLGLPAIWPRVARWRDRIVVATSGRLYEALPGAPGFLTTFRPMSVQPQSGAWALASNGASMLVGGADQVYAAEPDGSFSLVATVKGLLSLSLCGPDRCFAIGSDEIALLQFTDGVWKEAKAARIPGIPFLGAAWSSQRAVWIEMGSAGVARLSADNGELVLLKPALPWKDGQWINVGFVNDTVVISGAKGNRAFFDDAQKNWCEAPELRQLLERSPYWLVRVQQDSGGRLWATHMNGVVTFTPNGDVYEMDAASLDLVNDRFPQVQLLPGDDVWISAGRALHHVQRGVASLPLNVLPPVLIPTERSAEGWSRHSTGTGREIEVPFDQSSLEFWVFSASYRWMRTPVYEYRVSGSDRWSRFSSGTILSVATRPEGRRVIEVRSAEPRGLPQPVASFPFRVRSPWYRTWPAYLSYALLLVGTLILSGRLTNHLQRKKNLALEKLVGERTRQLEATMQKLNEETRNAATLAERNRLAGEIHDSLQQSLSGAMLQLDSTLMLPGIAPDLRNRMDIVRNMISFTRQEVQHAVWDLESPLTEGTELSAALQKLAGLINPGTIRIEVSISGEPMPLAPSIKHHLIRIAQEAITNAVRHARASRIAVQLAYASDAISLSILDDGVGFRTEDVREIGHFGLKGLRSRAKKLGARLEIRSQPGQGTSILVVSPFGSQLI